jgi:hypothetical protein
MLKRMSIDSRAHYQGGYYTLSSLYSFVPDTAVNYELIKQLKIGLEERLVGMYLNGADNFIVFTSKALYWVRKDRESICFYSEVKEIKLPAQEQVDDEREIEIALKDGDFLFLPVINDTEGLLDIYLVANFLQAAVSGHENLQELGDLIAKLKSEVERYKIQPLAWKQPMPVQYIETIIAYLEDCLSACLQETGSTSSAAYDVQRLLQPQTWRLMAEVILAPKTFGEGVRPPEPLA